MTRDERRRLAEQLTANPIYDILMAEIEARGIALMIEAKTDTERLETQAYVRATQRFRRDCAALLRSTPEQKPAPA